MAPREIQHWLLAALLASPDSAQQKGRFCFFVAEYLLEVLHIFKTKKENRIYGETHERGYDLREYELREYELRKQHTLRGPGNTHEPRELELREHELELKKSRS